MNKRSLEHEGGDIKNYSPRTTIIWRGEHKLSFPRNEGGNIKFYSPRVEGGTLYYKYKNFPRSRVVTGVGKDGLKAARPFPSPSPMTRARKKEQEITVWRKK